MANQGNTLEEIMVACGVPDDNVLFNGQSKPYRIAMEIFGGDFNTCMSMSFEDFDKECTTMAQFTVNQGQIRLTPSTKRNIKAFIQWTRDLIIIGVDPGTRMFTVDQSVALVRRYKLHKQFADKSKTISEAAKPEKLSETTKWTDWYPSFINFLKAIPGSSGVPLNYVIRDNEQPEEVEDPNVDFLTNYTCMAPLIGDAYVTDNGEVHTYITHFISGNAVAEAKMVAHAQANNGRSDYIALKEHFEGVGVNATEIVKAENIIQNLYYTGEKPPHMWWSEFEKELSRAFSICQKVEGRQVYSNAMKLRILMPKIKADFLSQPKAALMIELSKVPLTLRYEEALATFRNCVNQKHPPRVGANERTRRINQTNTFNNSGRSGGRGGRGGRSGRSNYYRGGYNGGGRGNGRYGGRNQANGRGRGGRFTNRRKTKNDSWWTVCDNGRVVECHPDISYPNQIWYDIPRADKQRITQLRSSSGQNQQRSDISVAISEMSTGTTTINGQQYALVPTNQSQQIQQASVQLPLPPPPANQPPPPPQQVTFMGGRNEQSSLRSRNQNA